MLRNKVLNNLEMTNGEANNILGFVDVVNEKVIKGWAFLKGDAKPVSIAVYVDGELITEGIANQHRAGILKKGIHPTGNCQYSIDVPAGTLKNNSVVSVYAGDERIELKKSPWVFEKEEKEEEYPKVLIVGLAKSGTSILTYKIGDALEEKEIFFEPDGANAFVNINQHRKITSKKSVVTKCIYIWNKADLKVEAISKLYNKRIWIVRDPRDNIISSFLYLWNKGHKPDPEKFKKAHDLVLKKEQDPSSVPFYKILESCLNAEAFATGKYTALVNQLNSMDKSDWFIVKYEDVVENNLIELNKYLGFDALNDASVPERFNRVVRSKKHGNWKNWFTKEDIEYFKPLHSGFLDYFDYDQDWELEENPVIDPKKGSAYMAKLFEGKG